ncbi:MAG TPA: glycosyltransferase family 4 protein [Candidatus Acidoferrales bacterium]|nr:glycosyltransferase family 4 protein [Candidatus Acidoferrales bacterium]
MHILFISTHLPLPANNGQSIRTLSIVRTLASLGHKTTFVAFAPNVRPETIEPLASYCCQVDLLGRNRTFSNVPDRPDYFGRLRCLLSRRAYSVERFRSGAMRETIGGHLRGGAFDLIVCDSMYALVNLLDTNVPIALHCHNVEHMIFRRYAEIERNPVRKYYAAVESVLIRRAERRACDRAVFAMACSEIDRTMLHEMGVQKPIFLVPNTIDTRLFSPPAKRSREGDGTRTILFQGGMDWFPNRDAVDFFVDKIFPLVRHECPDVKFVVAGRNPPSDFVAKFRHHAQIEFTGTVPDMRPYLSAATVVVVPLRLGSGTRIKILEACGAGRAVVSTSVGAEGLNLELGKEILVADDPELFARSVVQLLQDPVRRDSIGSAARKVIFEHYSEAALKESLHRALSAFSRPDSGEAADWVQSCFQPL